MEEAVKAAMKKMPDAKYIWMHPDDLKEVKIFVATTNLQAEARYIIPKGQFLLSENDLTLPL